MGFPLASPAERMSSHRENGTVAGGKRRGRPVSALKRRASYILRHGLHQLQCAVGSGFRQFACVLLCVALQTAQAGVQQAVGILRLTSRPPLFSPGLPFNPHFRGRGGSRRRWGRLGRLGRRGISRRRRLLCRLWSVPPFRFLRDAPARGMAGHPDILQPAERRKFFRGDLIEF